MAIYYCKNEDELKKVCFDLFSKNNFDCWEEAKDLSKICGCSFNNEEKFCNDDICEDKGCDLVTCLLNENTKNIYKYIILQEFEEELNYPVIVSFDINTYYEDEKFQIISVSDAKKNTKYGI